LGETTERLACSGLDRAAAFQKYSRPIDESDCASGGRREARAAFVGDERRSRGLDATGTTKMRPLQIHPKLPQKRTPSSRTRLGFLSCLPQLRPLSGAVGCRGMGAAPSAFAIGDMRRATQPQHGRQLRRPLIAAYILNPLTKLSLNRRASSRYSLTRASTTQLREIPVVTAKTVIHMVRPPCLMGPNAQKRIWFRSAASKTKRSDASFGALGR
jgi:hypothetical protein